MAMVLKTETTGRKTCSDYTRTQLVEALVICGGLQEAAAELKVNHGSLAAFFSVHGLPTSQVLILHKAGYDVKTIVARLKKPRVRKKKAVKVKIKATKPVAICKNTPPRVAALHWQAAAVPVHG